MAMTVKILYINAEHSSGLVNSWIGMWNSDFDCQGHNSLNFGPILKIFVPEHISFQDLQFLFAEHPRGTYPRGQKRVLKLVHEKKNHKSWKKSYFQGSFQLVFLKNHLSIS